MPDVQCLKIRIQPGRTDYVVDWIRGLTDRDPDGLNEVLANEGMVIESLFLERTPGADYLILYQRAEDLVAANAAFQASSHPLDQETRELIAETWAAVEPLELLADHARTDDGYDHTVGPGERPAD